METTTLAALTQALDRAARPLPSLVSFIALLLVTSAATSAPRPPVIAPPLPPPDTPVPEDSEFDTTPSASLRSYAGAERMALATSRAGAPAWDPRCPLGNPSFFDSANCHVATPPAGTTPFLWSNHFYYTPVRTRCSLPGFSFDGTNCAAGFSMRTGGFAPVVVGQRWRYQTNTYAGPLQTCGTEFTQIGRGDQGAYLCESNVAAPIGQTPSWATINGVPRPFYPPELYDNPSTSVDERCPFKPYAESGFDSVNCHVATVPSGVMPFIWSGSLYHTPYSGPPLALWGGQSRLRGVMATIYIHGRKASRGDSPIYGWGYTSWANNQKGSQPIWLAWNSWQRLTGSLPNGETNYMTVKNNLDLACNAPDLPCQVVCHSAGCLMTGFLLANFPGRWNIANVTAIQGAHGGSEVADIGIDWLPPRIKQIAALFGATRPIDYDLRTSSARSMYNHDFTSNAIWKTVSSEWEPHLRTAQSCNWWAWIIASPYCLGVEAWNAAVNEIMSFYHGIFGGDGDLLLAYHSTASFRTRAGSGNACFMSSPSSGHYWTNHTSLHRGGAANNACNEGYKDVMHIGERPLKDLWGIPPY